MVASLNPHRFKVLTVISMGRPLPAGPTLAVGVIYKLTPAGTLTTLWQFSGGAADGGEPIGGLVQGSDSNFYGTASAGGSHSAGVVFRISSAGIFSNLYNFTGAGDGGSPGAGLVQGFDTNFYGTTSIGGTNGGNGTIFRITPAGTLTTVYRFKGGVDGGEPEAGLIQGSDTNLYGTTFIGGHGNGVVFQLSSAGTLTPLHSFAANGSDGANPVAGLIFASDGLLYGTTSGGGTNGNGTVFRVNTTGTTFTNVCIFGGGPGGGISQGGLVQGVDSNFYGTTSSGGTGNNGNVFKLVLASSTTNTLTQITSILVVGTDVYVLLPTLNGETYQLQFSNSMNPTNWANVVGASQAGTGSLITLTNIGGALQPQRFYRVDISP